MINKLHQPEALEFSAESGAVGKHQIDTRHRFDKIVDGVLDVGHYTVHTGAKAAGAAIGTGISSIRGFIEKLAQHAKR